MRGRRGRFLGCRAGCEHSHSLAEGRRLGCQSRHALTASHSSGESPVSVSEAGVSSTPRYRYVTDRNVVSTLPQDVDSMTEVAHTVVTMRRSLQDSVTKSCC